MNLQPNQFFVKSGSDSFKSRQKSIFDLLATEEKNVNLANDQPEEMEVDIVDRRSAKRVRRETRALRGQESLFKTPGTPPPRKKCMPDFQRNPHRWTKYTLADVPASDMSEATNTAAALSFLRRRKKSPEPPPRDESLRFTSRRIRSRTTNDEESLPVVSQPSRVGFGDACEPIEETPPPEKPIYLNGKLIMPEYVIGEKRPKAKKTISKSKTEKKELKLSHLLDYEDE